MQQSCNLLEQQLGHHRKYLLFASPDRHRFKTKKPAIFPVGCSVKLHKKAFATSYKAIIFQNFKVVRLQEI